MEGNSGVYDHNNNPDSDDNYNECQETQDSGNDTDADADHSEECHEDDESDEDYQYEEEDEMHPNDEDDLVVNIDASEVVPAEGVQVDVETCPAAASSSSIESTDALFEGITVDPTSKKSERSQLRTQMKKYHPDEELDYWWKMCRPTEPDVEREARKALETSEKKTKTGKRKREERIQQAIDRGDVKGGGKSQTYHSREAFEEDLLTADISMFKAVKNKFHCDGTHLRLFDAAKMCEGIRKDHRRRGPVYSRRSRSAPPTSKAPEELKPIFWSSKRVANDLGYTVVPKEDLKTLPGDSFSVYDVNGRAVLYSLANYFGRGSVREYTSSLLELATQVKLSTCQADAKTRGANYSFVDGRPVGCVNFTHCWRGLGGKKGDLKPSASSVNGGNTGVTKSATTFNSIQGHHQKSRKYNTLVNMAIYRLHEPGFWAYLRMSTTIRKRLPAAAAIATHDPAFSTGKSVIYSRNTPLHFDNKEAPEGWSPLIVMGTCKTGMLSIPRLGIKFPYLPGHLVLLRGRLLDHEVIEWDGKDIRICIAHFTHVDEWSFAGIVPPL